MKKFGVLVAAAALTLTTQITAQDTAEATAEITSVASAVQEDYTPLEIGELPETVATAVATDFAGATIAEAYKDAEENYKLVLVVGEESKTVYANAAGEWIESNE